MEVVGSSLTGGWVGGVGAFPNERSGGCRANPRERWLMVVSSPISSRMEGIVSSLTDRGLEGVGSCPTGR